ncbi:FAD/NAD(P)-binding domain-containing protein [Aspergillus violaceofuscus CBS 115571]|uniref:FAD/NAD(P)-binding domain-containing protein n=1 Tax=Aspergillus violaceofuscus (strain CBS 115571) TaxID=1450538 RepID=A0A2V5GWF6_ASPV1|nr:FAD/NAD(P)-binding domain-containing protein [Aspergillus violaceofuscus CBS 115571]
MGSYSPTAEYYDAIVVGAGFGGCNLLHQLRKLHFHTRVFEEGAGLGGVWYHNRYPGARVDTKTPFYEFSDPELYNEWEWSERYPGQAEILRYFAFVDQKWDLSRDIEFGTRVTDARWDDAIQVWRVQTNQGHCVECRFLILSMGFAAKKYIPVLDGLEDFRGFMCHTADWPDQEVDLQGKRVAVMGTGATGVQVIQELGPKVGELVVLQRSPNCALPMRQQQQQQQLQSSPQLSMGKKGTTDKTSYPKLFANMRLSLTGSDDPPTRRNAADDNPAQRLELYERLWAKGGFAPAHGNYQDMMTSLDANTFFYDFWRDKTRARLTCAQELVEHLAPTHPPFAFGTKRPSLEQRFYEVFNQDNVTLVPLKQNPIARVIPTGIQLADGTTIALDALVLATGFDAVTGGFTRLRISGIDTAQDLAAEWRIRTRTHLGMVTAGFPNLFFQYGPQSPTAFANGPLISEIQAEWILATMVYMRERGYVTVDVKPEMEERWGRVTEVACARTLMGSNETTWYMGGNVPGKKREALGYMGGLPKYQQYLRECIEGGWEGFGLR